MIARISILSLVGFVPGASFHSKEQWGVPVVKLLVCFILSIGL